MANVATNSIAATYGGAQLNEIFYEPVFRSDNIMGNYRVIPNVKHKMNVYTSAALTKIVDPYTACSATSGSTQFDIDDKVITAGRCRVALEQCTDEFFGTYIEEMYRSGADVMKRIAAPMVGGTVSVLVMVLFVLPAIFVIWKAPTLSQKIRKEPISNAMSSE